MARPRKPIDLELIEKLAAIHCTNSEIAATVGCDSSLLSKPRFSGIIQKGKERGKISLRRKMFETAMGGNVTMQIWLSKQYLGFTDKVEQSIHETGPVKQIEFKVKWADENEPSHPPDAPKDSASKKD